MAENKIVVKGNRYRGNRRRSPVSDWTFRLWEKYIASMPEPSGEE